MSTVTAAFPPPPTTAFRKRTFALDEYGQSVRAVLRSSPTMLRALLRPRTSRRLREEVMLAVTSVNDCRYCDWLHTQTALSHGADLEALEETLGGSLEGSRSTREQVAVLYGQHYANTHGRPDDSARQALAAAWGKKERAEIDAYIAVINFGNLTGNSADAWLARLRGTRGAGAHPIGEAVAALVGAPILAAIYVRSRAFTVEPGARR